MRTDVATAAGALVLVIICLALEPATATHPGAAQTRDPRPAPEEPDLVCRADLAHPPPMAAAVTASLGSSRPRRWQSETATTTAGLGGDRSVRALRHAPMRCTAVEVQAWLAASRERRWQSGA